jgi:hypothetical protein
MTFLVRPALVLWLVALTLGLGIVWVRGSHTRTERVEPPPRESCAVFFFNYNIRSNATKPAD